MNIQFIEYIFNKIMVSILVLLPLMSTACSSEQNQSQGDQQETSVDSGVDSEIEKKSETEVGKHSSLKEFCIRTAADSVENCECGQATANTIMTAEEQAIALALMKGNSEATKTLADNRDEFMAKLSKVSAGCKN